MVQEITYEEMQRLINAAKGTTKEGPPAAKPEYEVIDLPLGAATGGGAKPTPAPIASKGAQIAPKAEQDQMPSPIGLPGVIGEELLKGNEQIMRPTKEEAVALARYGAPIAATFATSGLSFLPSLMANAGVAGASEFSARQLERGINSPEGQHVMEDLKAGKNMALLDAGITAGTTGVAKLFSMGIRRLATSRLGGEILKARKLFKNNVERAAAKKTGKVLDEDDPFDLTISELSREDGGFVAALDNFASSGTGEGIMTRYNKKRLDYYSQVIDDYYSDLIDTRDKHGLASFVNQALGDVRNPGDIIRPVDAYKKHLYNLFDTEMTRNHASATIDLSHVRKYLKTKKNSQALKVYRSVRANYMELLPPLDPKRAIGKGASTQTEKEIADQWRNVSVIDAEKAYREMDGMMAEAKMHNLADLSKAGDLTKRIKSTFTDFVESQPELNRLWKEAKNFKGKQAEILENKLIYKIRNKLKDEPAAVAELFKTTNTNAAVVHDNLIRLKEAFNFSAGTAKGQKLVPKDMAGKFNLPSPKQAAAFYDENILQPLRFEFLKKSMSGNNLSGSKLLKSIESVEKSSLKYLPELFGGDMQVRNLRALGRVLQEAEAQKEKSIFIALKTAGAVSGMAGTGALLFSDNPELKTIGGLAAAGSAAILIGPYALAKILTKPGLTKEYVDGIRRSPTFFGDVSPKLLQAMRRTAEMKVSQDFFNNKPSSASIQYYTVDSEPEQNE